MKTGDFVADKKSLGRLVGKSNSGSWVVEWTDGEFWELKEDQLLLIEEAGETDGIPSEN